MLTFLRFKNFETTKKNKKTNYLNNIFILQCCVWILINPQNKFSFMSCLTKGRKISHTLLR